MVLDETDRLLDDNLNVAVTAPNHALVAQEDNAQLRIQQLRLQNCRILRSAGSKQLTISQHPHYPKRKKAKKNIEKLQLFYRYETRMLTDASHRVDLLRSTVKQLVEGCVRKRIFEYLCATCRGTFIELNHQR